MIDPRQNAIPDEPRMMYSGSWVPCCVALAQALGEWQLHGMCISLHMHTHYIYLAGAICTDEVLSGPRDDISLTTDAKSTLARPNVLRSVCERVRVCKGGPLKEARSAGGGRAKE